MLKSINIHLEHPIEYNKALSERFTLITSQDSSYLVLSKNKSQELVNKLNKMLDEYENINSTYIKPSYKQEGYKGGWEEDIKNMNKNESEGK